MEEFWLIVACNTRISVSAVMRMKQNPEAQKDLLRDGFAWPLPPVTALTWVE
jgi:hypothetical protein